MIQGRGLPFILSDTVPLGYRSEIVGDLTISIDHADGDLADRDIYLEDTKTGIMHNLRKGSYSKKNKNYRSYFFHNQKC